MAWTAVARGNAMSDEGTVVFAAGARLGQRYRIEGLIGTGGMATVYRVFDEQERVECAAKVLIPDLAAVMGEQRFAREVKILSRLRHPRIVPILDSGLEEQLPYYIMPLLNESLEARLQREQRFGVKEAVTIIQHVAEGLAAAHRDGFVHRDIKPANILFAGDEARVADFGIARGVSSGDNETLTATGVVVGTARYMSPEQGAGQKVDARSDIYSLACVLYELLAGTPPFTGPTQTVLARHALEIPALLHPFRPSVTEALDREIQRALAKVPGDRHATVEEFAAAIGVAAQDTSSASRPEHDARPTRRARVWASALLGVAVATIAIAWWRTRAPTTPLDDNRIIVFPLSAPASRGLPIGVGEDVATLIGNALGRTEPLRWVDGWSVLAPDARSQAGDVPPTVLRDAALARRARFMLTGRLTPIGDSIAVVLALSDVRGDSLVAEHTEKGSRAEPWRQALRAANALLPALIPGRAREMGADWLNRPPAAIAAFLLGEAAFRRAQPGEALDHYRRALDADSTFALAAFRGAQAASWEHAPAKGIALLDSVRGATLSPRDLAFASGLRGYLAGDADSAARSFQRAVAIDRDFAEAWTQLGETFTHLIPSDGTGDALADSAFSEARRIDPGAATTLLHPIEIRLRARDGAGAAPLLTSYEKARPDTLLIQQLRLMRECVENPTRADWGTAARETPLSLLTAGSSLAAGSAPPPCAAHMFATLLAADTAAGDAPENRRFYALVGRTNLFIVAGEAGRAVEEIDAFISRWKFGSSLFLLYAPLVPELQPRARELLRTESATAGADWRGMPFAVRLWALGGVAIQAGDRAAGEAIGRELQRRADSTHSARDQLMAGSIAARLALANADTSGAIDRLTTLIRTPISAFDRRWDEAASLAPERILLSRLLLARGEWQRAQTAAATVGSAWAAFMPGYRAMALDAMAGAADSMGDRSRGQTLRNELAKLQTAARAAMR